MTARAMKIGLIVLAVINVFALAAVATMAVSLNRIESRVEEQRRPGRGGGGSTWTAIGALSPETRDRVKTTLRESALAARPDFEEARTARKAALSRALETPYDGAAVRALLASSREAEMRGRSRIEDDTTALLDTLTVEERAAVAPLLSRHGPRGRGGRDGRRSDRDDRPPED
ncbi:periplasmic heavy metal sensor [Brevundimonas poindexterae]|uniref:periplasmic heavy metal sensor n=1 Tax=Brevundimonas poindexterae TaxID=74325 RepID=UPI001CFCD19D|nr:periplasmic heavy metal sensor [Brevundimonas poindexterae]